MYTHECVSLQTMITSYPDILNEGETIEKFVEVTAIGKGKTDRSRAYVRGIAIRYVEKHGQHHFEMQKARRLPLSQSPTPTPAAAAAVTTPEAVTPAVTPVTTSNKS